MEFTPGEINIICSDLDAALRFYRDVLGFSAQTDAEGFYHLRKGGRQFLLLSNAQPVPDPPPYEGVPQLSMDLNVADPEAAYHYLREQGVTIAQAWQPGAQMFVIRDPDGLPWEVVGPD